MQKHHQISIYLSPGSRLCSLTKEYFRDAGLDFYEYDVVKDHESMRAMEQKSKQKETPVVEIDGRIICGYQPEVFTTILTEKDKRDIAQ